MFPFNLTSIARNALVAGALAVSASFAQAAGGGMALLNASIDLGDKSSLQRGAGLYMNNCVGCHSLEFMRYKRLAEDLDIDLDIAEQELVDGAARGIVSEIRISMTDDFGGQSFGVAPPDLSVRARSRGTDWIYSYLMTFYKDDNPARPFGVNNVVYPGASMPHVLWGLQGEPTLVKAEVPEGVEGLHATRLAVDSEAVRVVYEGHTADGTHVVLEDRLIPDGSGSMTLGEYQRASRDLSAFLTYAAEPAALKRADIGFWVLIFLGILIIVSRMLYKEYWRDIH